MPARKVTRQMIAAPNTQTIPDLPKATPDMLDLPGMLTHEQNMQQWWTRFKRSAMLVQTDSDKTTRKLSSSFQAGLLEFSASFTEDITVITNDVFALSGRATVLEASVFNAATSGGLLARVNVIESAYVDASGAEAATLSVVSAELAGPSGRIYGAVLAESNARIAADGQIHLRWGVALNLNGNIIGQINLDGSNQSSEFSVLVDKFYVGNPSGNIKPFEITGSKVRFTADVEIDGSLLLAGTLTLSQVGGAGLLAAKDTVALATDVTGAGALAAKSSVNLNSGEVTNKSLANLDSSADSKLGGISAGADVTLQAVQSMLVIGGGGIQLDAGGALRGGASNFTDDTGFFLGYEGGQYKFRVGVPGPSGPRISWDGSAWEVINFGGAAPTGTLTLSNTTGNPLNNPSGAGTYPVGTRVLITAVNPAEPGGLPFDQWISNADSAINALDSATAASTYVTIIGDMTLLAQY